jgi:hypothetical protein
MYGYGFSMVFNSIATAVRAAGEIFNRLTEDGINRVMEDNQQRIIE